MKYIIVQSDTLLGLVEAVNAKMVEGWVAVGGVSVAMLVQGILGATETDLLYIQALTKEAD